MGALPGWRAYEGQLAWEKYKAEALDRSRIFAYLLILTASLVLGALVALMLKFAFPDFFAWMISAENLFFATISLVFIYLTFVEIFAVYFVLQINYPENLIWNKTYREVKFPWRLKRKGE